MAARRDVGKSGRLQVRKVPTRGSSSAQWLGVAVALPPLGLRTASGWSAPPCKLRNWSTQIFWGKGGLLVDTISIGSWFSAAGFGFGWAFFMRPELRHRI
jgi:hypothetical protein